MQCCGWFIYLHISVSASLDIRGNLRGLWFAACYTHKTGNLLRLDYTY